MLEIKKLEDWNKIDLWRLLRKVALPVIALSILTFSFFGVESVWEAFQASLKHDYLSANALNFNWVLTHFLHVLLPQQFGNLSDGEARFIVTTDWVTLIPRLLFILAYVSTLAAFFKRDKTFENLILFSVIGYMAYFTFNIGVHENHLFLVALLSIILYWIKKDHLATMIILVLMSNANLFVFFGFKGYEQEFSRVILDTVDIAVILALFNVAFFLYLWWTNIFPKEETSATPTLRTTDGIHINQ